MPLPPDILKAAQDELSQWRVRKRTRLPQGFLNRPSRRKSKAKCVECDDQVFAKTRCKRHYFQRWRLNLHRVGRKTLPRLQRTQCECGRPAQRNGWCYGCNQAYRASSPKKQKSGAVALCKEPGCSQSVQAFGRCNKHYLRWRKKNPKQCDCGRWHHCRGNVCSRCRSRALYAKGHKCPGCQQRKVMTPGQRCARCLYKDQPCACGRPRIYPKSCATCYKRNRPRARSLDAVNTARYRREARAAQRIRRRA